MGRRKFTEEFKREGVSLIRDRGVSVAQGSALQPNAWILLISSVGSTGLTM